MTTFKSEVEESCDEIEEEDDSDDEHPNDCDCHYCCPEQEDDSDWRGGDVTYRYQAGSCWFHRDWLRFFP
jgi:hypothetical protein